MGRPENASSAYWEKVLKDAGMPAQLPQEMGGAKRIRLGNGLGIKSLKEEETEDKGQGHSRMCPINLGYGVSNPIDQPNDRPVESAVIRKRK